MAKKAKSIREIREVCRPRPLQGKAELDAYFEETASARDPNARTRKQLEWLLPDNKDDFRRILLYGHQGCGKSTELEKLIVDLGSGWEVIKYSVLEDLPPVGVTAPDVLLTLALRLAEREDDGKNPFGFTTEDLANVQDYFKTNSEKLLQTKDSQLGASATASAKTPSLLASIFSLKAEAKSELKFGTTRERTIITEARKRPGDLVRAVNDLIEIARNRIPAEKRLVFILEDLDKLSLEDADQVFIRNAQMLAGIKANIVYTIPIFTFHSPEAGALKAQFDNSFCLPMIKVWDPVAKEKAEGFAVITKILEKRLETGLLAPDALELLILKTGGVLRHVFEVLNTVSLMTNLHAAPIKAEHVRYALTRLKNELSTQIALPRGVKIDGLDSVKQLRDRLREAVKRQNEGTPCPPAGDVVTQVLLRASALVEYNGKGWLGVHPLIEEYLNDFGAEPTIPV